MSYKNQILKQLTNGKYGKKLYLDLIRKKSNDRTKQFQIRESDIILFNPDQSPINIEMPIIPQNISNPKHFKNLKHFKNSYPNDKTIKYIVNANKKKFNKKNKRLNNDTLLGSVKNMTGKLENNSFKESNDDVTERSENNSFKESNDVITERSENNSFKESNDVITEQSENNSFKESNSFEESNGVITEQSENNLSIINSQEQNKIILLEQKIFELDNYIIQMADEIKNLINDQKKIISVLNKLSAEINIARNKITR